MARYNFSRLGDETFERFAQALIKKVIGPGTATFGPGRDGGREATFEGAAPYPSTHERWDGRWLFQVKFHDLTLASIEQVRSKLPRDLATELDKLRTDGIFYDNYILITNVPLTAYPQAGTIDTLTRLASSYADVLTRFSTWGADDLSAFVDGNGDIRTSYVELLQPGDVIQELLSGSRATREASIIDSYASHGFTRERFARLEEAGDANDDKVPLQAVFIDLDVDIRASRLPKRRKFGPLEPYRSQRQGAVSEAPSYSALAIMNASDADRIVLIGGPGQGKSTLAQYLVQIHRAALLNRLSELDAKGDLPQLSTTRIPFRVILRPFGQWLGARPDKAPLERYLAEDMSSVTGMDVDVDTVLDIIRGNPTLLVLDGLDEVPDPATRALVIDAVTEFLEHAERVLGADVQVVATSRPTGYGHEFEAERYLHLTIKALTTDQIQTYVDRWVEAKQLDGLRDARVKEIFAEIGTDSHVSRLLTNPLQVTIVLVIVLAGGTPPAQREALFHDYVEVIYKRETSKAKELITSSKQELLGFHAYFAYQLHKSAGPSEAKVTTLDEAAFRNEVQRYVSTFDPYALPAELRAKVDRFVIEAKDRLVLIVESLEGQFGFELRSFEEYFAAAHLVDGAASTEQRLERFRAIGAHPRWHNVGLFLAGRVGRAYPGEAPGLVQTARTMNSEGWAKYLRPGSWLLLDLATDQVFGANRPLQRAALEGGLELITAPPAAWEAGDIDELVNKLPAQDIADLLLPLLRARRESVADRFLLRVAQIRLAARSDEGDILEMIVAGLDSGQEEALEQFYRMALRGSYPAEWVAPLIQKLCDTTSDSYVATHVGTGISAKPLVWAAAFLSQSPDPSLVEIVVQEVLESRDFLSFDRSDSKEWERLAELADSSKTGEEFAVWLTALVNQLPVVRPYRDAHRRRDSILRNVALPWSAVPNTTALTDLCAKPSPTGRIGLFTDVAQTIVLAASGAAVDAIGKVRQLLEGGKVSPLWLAHVLAARTAASPILRAFAWSLRVNGVAGGEAVAAAAAHYSGEDGRERWTSAIDEIARAAQWLGEPDSIGRRAFGSLLEPREDGWAQIDGLCKRSIGVGADYLTTTTIDSDTVISADRLAEVLGRLPLSVATSKSLVDEYWANFAFTPWTYDGSVHDRGWASIRELIAAEDPPWRLILTIILRLLADEKAPLDTAAQALNDSIRSPTAQDHSVYGGDPTAAMALLTRLGRLHVITTGHAKTILQVATESLYWDLAQISDQLTRQGLWTDFVADVVAGMRDSQSKHLQRTAALLGALLQPGDRSRVSAYIAAVAECGDRTECDEWYGDWSAVPTPTDATAVALWIELLSEALERTTTSSKQCIVLGDRLDDLIDSSRAPIVVREAELGLPLSAGV